MSRKSDIPLRKHTLFLYEGDLDRLAELHPEKPKSVIVRMVVRGHINQVNKMTKRNEWTQS